MIYPWVTLILINNLHEHADGGRSTLEGNIKLSRGLANRAGDRIKMSRKTPFDSQQLRDTPMSLNSVRTMQIPMFGDKSKLREDRTGEARCYRAGSGAHFTHQETEARRS